jgi:vancomycin resistance protein YoaR
VPRRRAAVAVLLCVVAVVALALGVRATHSGKVLPGVRVEGVALGGASRAEVVRRLRPIAESAAATPVTLVAEDREEAVLPKQAGYFADVEQTASRALDSGRHGLLGGLWSTFAGLFAGRDVPLAETIDRAQLRRMVAMLAGRLGRPSFPGELVIEPGTLAISTNPPRSGREVDQAKLELLLAAALTLRSRASVEVPLRTKHVADRAAVDAVGRAARKYLNAPLRVTGAGDPIEVSPGEVAGVLALEARDGGASVGLGAGDRRLAALVAEIASKRDRPAVNAQIDATAPDITFDAKGDASWKPRPVEVSVTSPAQDAIAVDRDKLAAAIDTAIHEDRHTVALTMGRSEPAMSAESARDVRALIGTFTTYYVPGQPRVKNIQQIAKDVDGTVVAPGAQFSLNETAGERTEEKGYVKAPFIADGRIEPSIGGGVSQFSTTLYNAAYFAGLQIDGHRPHSFFIDRYPAGREATLNFPDIDMTWTNDTDAPVLIRTSSDDDSVRVDLFGDNGGRRVSAESGERTPLTDGDFELTVTRVVRYAGGDEMRQAFTTRYDKPPADE